MANTIAYATGGDKSREKTVSRLGSRYASVQAQTRQTKIYARVDWDGTCIVEVSRNGKFLLSWTYDKPEGEDNG